MIFYILSPVAVHYVASTFANKISAQTDVLTQNDVLFSISTDRTD